MVRALPGTAPRGSAPGPAAAPLPGVARAHARTPGARPPPGSPPPGSKKCSRPVRWAVPRWSPRIRAATDRAPEHPPHRAATSPADRAPERAPHRAARSPPRCHRV